MSRPDEQATFRQAGSQAGRAGWEGGICDYRRLYSVRVVVVSDTRHVAYYHRYAMRTEAVR